MANHARHIHKSTMMVVAAAVLILGTAACGDDDSDLPPPADSPPAAGPTASSNLDPADAEAAEEILAAFDSYMEGLIELSQEGVPGGTEETEARLEKVHVSGPAYDELAYDLLTPNARAGHATAGTITWEVEVLDIDWERTLEHRPGEVIPEATLEVCFDETAWTTVNAETGEVIDGPGQRYISTVIAVWRDEDPQRPERESRWEIAEREDGSEAC